jgi:DNA-binding NarL/FixJ family response regulator
MRVVLADDHPVSREGLCRILQQRGIEIVGEASDGQAAIEAVRTAGPDVVILDIGMPILNGIEAARQIRAISPQTKILLLTVHKSEEYVSEALRVGVLGYVLKDQASREIADAIEQVSNGKVYLSPGISQAVVTALMAGEEPAWQTLTPRERQVLQLVAEGKTTKEVGVILGVSTKTADSHRTRLMRKLDIHDTAGLVRYALRKGLIQP